MAGAVGRAAALLRDEFDRGRALCLLRVAAGQLAEIAEVDLSTPRPQRAGTHGTGPGRQGRAPVSRPGFPMGHRKAI